MELSFENNSRYKWSSHSTWKSNFKASELFTALLIALIIVQDPGAHVDPAVMIEIKKDIQKENHQQVKNQADIIYDQLNPLMKQCVDLAKEKGSSSWLSPIPLAEHGFHLHKGEFRDALHLRYGWNLLNIPQSHNCGTNFSVNHAMTCHMGGVPTIRHNDTRFNRFSTNRSLPQCSCGISATTIERWITQFPIRQLKRWYLLRHLSERFLEQWLRSIFWCVGISPQCTKQLFHKHLFLLQQTWEYQEKRIWPTCQRGWVRRFHSSCFLHHRWHGLRRIYIL